MAFAPAGRIRHVSKSSLSHDSSTRGAPMAVAEKSVIQRAKLAISYAPGVHAGSDSRTGAVPAVVNVMATSTTWRSAFALTNVTSYFTSWIGAETVSRTDCCAWLEEAAVRTVTTDTAKSRIIAGSYVIPSTRETAGTVRPNPVPARCSVPHIHALTLLRSAVPRCTIAPYRREQL